MIKNHKEMIEIKKFIHDTNEKFRKEFETLMGKQKEILEMNN